MSLEQAIFGMISDKVKYCLSHSMLCFTTVGNAGVPGSADTLEHALKVFHTTSQVL